MAHVEVGSVSQLTNDGGHGALFRGTWTWRKFRVRKAEEKRKRIKHACQNTTSTVQRLLDEIAGGDRQNLYSHKSHPK